MNKEHIKADQDIRFIWRLRELTAKELQQVLTDAKNAKNMKEWKKIAIMREVKRRTRKIENPDR